VTDTSRAKDDQVLHWLALRTRGKNAYQVAVQENVSKSYVHIQTHNVLLADLDQSGEPPEIVKAHYWKQRGPKVKK